MRSVALLAFVTVAICCAALVAAADESAAVTAAKASCPTYAARSPQCSSANSCRSVGGKCLWDCGSLSQWTEPRSACGAGCALRYADGASATSAACAFDCAAFDGDAAACITAGDCFPVGARCAQKAQAALDKVACDSAAARPAPSSPIVAAWSNGTYCAPRCTFFSSRTWCSTQQRCEWNMRSQECVEKDTAQAVAAAAAAVAPASECARYKVPRDCEQNARATCFWINGLCRPTCAAEFAGGSGTCTEYAGTLRVCVVAASSPSSCTTAECGNSTTSRQCAELNALLKAGGAAGCEWIGGAEQRCSAVRCDGIVAGASVCAASAHCRYSSATSRCVSNQCDALQSDEAACVLASRCVFIGGRCRAACSEYTSEAACAAQSQHCMWTNTTAQSQAACRPRCELFSEAVCGRTRDPAGSATEGVCAWYADPLSDFCGCRTICEYEPADSCTAPCFRAREYGGLCTSPRASGTAEQCPVLLRRVIIGTIIAAVGGVGLLASGIFALTRCYCPGGSLGVIARDKAPSDATENDSADDKVMTRIADVDAVAE